MLNESTLEALSERLVNRIEQANIYTLRLLGNRIKEIGTLLPSDAHRLIQLFQYGADVDKIMQELARVNSLNIIDIYDIFDELAKKEYYFAKDFYNYRGISYIPFEQNISLQQQVKAIADITVNEYMNITKTTGFTLKNRYDQNVFLDMNETYRDVIDKALVSVSQGTEGYQQRMFSTIKQLGSSGIKTLEYESGRKRRLDSAVRMNIMDGMRELSNKVQEQIGKDVGTDAVEISVHENPALDHADIQGHIFMNEEFEKMQSNQPFKDISNKSYEAIERAISTWNCYHYIFTVIADISKPQYTQEQLNEILERNKKGFDLDGDHYTMYEGSQLQRKLETAIRQQKDIQITAKESGNNELVEKSQKKINQLTTKYNELSKTSELPTKIDRLRVYDYKKVNSKDINISNYTKDNHPKHVLKEVIKKPTDEKILEKLSIYENNIKNDKIENAIVITKGGEIYQCYGSENAVWPDIDLGDKLIGSSITHNHPITETNYSFSETDIKLFEKYELSKLRGVDEIYTYELDRSKKPILKSPIFEEEIEDNTLYHLIVIDYAIKNNVRYMRWKNDK